MQCILFLKLSVKFLDQSARSDKDTDYESEQQHRLDQISEHRYDSLSVTTHTYLELC